ncbi:hypothetical protein [Streptomyces sp. NPDC026673]|uniref:hypothetical protein n=1 Tax=Streptomyces sp. NPDC026673 TaxID=3155724 RepID=UPI0033E10BD8
MPGERMNGQLSSGEALRRGVHAMQQASDGIARINSDVQVTSETLTGGYAGADGAAFNRLLTEWLSKANNIKISIDGLVNALEETTSRKQTLLAEHTDLINRAMTAQSSTATENSAYSTLMSSGQ